MRIHTMNLRAGGGARVASLVERVVRHAADVTVLTEFRNGAAGDALRRQLAAVGFEYQLDGGAPSRTNGVLVASKVPILREEAELEEHRLVLATVRDVVVGGAYLPLNRPKVTFWRERLLPLAARLAHRPALLIGDFNTGDWRDRAVATPFHGEAELAELLAAAWADAWRHLNPEAREYSWFSFAKNGFLLDHAYLSPPLAPRLTAAWLSHSERLEGATDHSALVIEVRD